MPGRHRKDLVSGGRRGYSINGCTKNNASAANFVVLPEQGDAGSPKWNKGTVDGQLGLMSTANSPTDHLEIGMSAYCRTPGTDVLAAYTFGGEQLQQKTFSVQRRVEVMSFTTLTVQNGPCSDGDELEVVWRVRNTANTTITQGIDNHILWARVGVILQ